MEPALCVLVLGVAAGWARHWCEGQSSGSGYGRLVVAADVAACKAGLNIVQQRLVLLRCVLELILEQFAHQSANTTSSHLLAPPDELDFDADSFFSVLDQHRALVLADLHQERRNGHFKSMQKNKCLGDNHVKSIEIMRITNNDIQPTMDRGMGRAK